jgi:presenilin 1
VFYSVLVARASDLDMSVTAGCFLAVITGLCSTLFLLALAGKALPALPISIALGIAVYFLSVSFVQDAVDQYVSLGIMV